MTQSTLALHAPSDVEEPQPAVTTTGWRWQRIALFASLLLAAGLWFAPTIVARTELRHRIIPAVLPAYPENATVGNASLSWFAPPVLRDLTFFDGTGERLLLVDELRASKPLIRLILDADRNLGHLTITKPHLTVRFRAGGSNLEDVLRPLIEGPASLAGISCEIHDGKARWIAPNGAPISGGLDESSLFFSKPEGSSKLDRFDFSGRLSDGEHAGPVKILLQQAPTSPEIPEYSIRASDLPLAPLQVVFDRLGASATLSGTLGADLLISVSSAESSSWWVDGRIDAKRLKLTMPRHFGNEPLLTESVSVSGKVTSNEDSFAFENIVIESDIGTFNAVANISKTLTESSTWGGWATALPSQDIKLAGRVDLARVAPLLPRTAQLHRPIQSGEVTFDLRTSSDPQRRRVSTRLRIADVSAGVGDERVIWQQPLTADVVIQSDADGLSCERLDVSSDFFSLSGSASSRQGEIRFKADLDRLHDQLKQFAALAEGSLAGQADGRLTIRRIAPGDVVHTRFDSVLRNVELSLAGRQWSERSLSIGAEADLEIANRTLKRIAKGQITLASAEGDRFTSILNEPVSWAGKANWSFTTSVTGEISRWLARLKASFLMPPSNWSMNGSLDAKCVVDHDGTTIKASNIDATLDRLQVRLAEQVFDEPYVRLSGDAAWNQETNRLLVTKSRLESETAIVEMSKVDVPLATAGPASGRIRIRGGIGRLARYLLPPRPPVWVSGVVAGELALKTEEGATSTQGTFSFERPTVSLPVVSQAGSVVWQPVWSDGEATLAINARYRHGARSLEFESFRLAATGATLDAAGRLDRIDTVADADLHGHINYDLEALMTRMPSILPSGIRIQGRSRDAFSLRGPLLSPLGIDPALRADAGFGWKQADLWGLTVGEGHLSTTLDRASLRLGPFETTVSGGRVRGSAAIALNDAPTLAIDKGRVAENIAITPEISRQWLRYAVPALADAADIEGTASADVAACAIPLHDPARSHAEGVLILGSLEATPGPLGRSILESVRQIQRIADRDATSGSDLRLFAPAQGIKCRIERNRVFHDRFAVRLGDQDGPIIATSGSVGFDESLDLIAEIPLEAKWFREERVGRALGGQVLRIPIRGTLSSPVPDPRAFQDLARRAATGAVENLINRQLEKQIGDPLKKLLDR